MAKNATSFKKGQVANPKGRPKKGYSITEWFRSMLKARPEVRDAIGNSIIKKALNGDSAAQKLVWGYMDGLPKLTHEVHGDIKISFHKSLKQNG